jgi:hypothetical protein
LVSPVRISFYTLVGGGLHFTLKLILTFGRQLWSSVPEAAGTRIWFSASNGVGQSLAKGSNSCKDLPIASADVSIKVK